MPSFYKIVPPPRGKDQLLQEHVGYLVREDHERKPTGGKWLAAACVILCLSITVALCGAVGDRPMSDQKGFLPVSSRQTAAVSAQNNRAPVPFPTATNPLRWSDLTLMLRTGLSDNEIIAAIADKQSVVPIGAVQEAELRELGAGEQLLIVLRTRRLYAAPTNAEALPPAPQAVNAAPGAVSVALPVTASQVPATNYALTPVYYVTRDRQIASLQARIDELDERIRRIRINPNRYWYNRDYGIDRQQGMDRYLDQLDKERNELRRQKWQLEGR